MRFMRQRAQMRHMKHMSGKQLALLLRLLITLSACEFMACGAHSGPSMKPTLKWVEGEAVRWARLNPCACLSSDEHMTSIELRPLAEGEEPSSEPQEGLGVLWERVALPRPLSPETQAALTLLQETQGSPLKLQSDLSALTVTLKSHRVRLLRSLALLPREEPSPQSEGEGEPKSELQGGEATLP